MWDVAGAVQRVFGDTILLHYNVICRMIPQELLEKGYDKWPSFKTYDGFLEDLRPRHVRLGRMR